MRATSHFRVIIRYREPTYAAHHEPKAKPYEWTFRIKAATAAAAKGQALGEFHAIAALSSVGWVREIVDVDVNPTVGW